ncbi:Tyrosine--tRNA ligase [compost metagenome]
MLSEVGFLKSKSEAQRELKGNSISINKAKVNADYSVSANDLIDGKFLLIQKGKKNYFIVSVI